MTIGAFKVSQRQDEVIIKDPNLMTPFLGEMGTQGAQQKAEGWSCGRGWPPQVLCGCFSDSRPQNEKKTLKTLEVATT